MKNDSLYKEELMDHFKYPRQKKNVQNPDFSNKQENISCGDSVSISGKIKKDEKGISRIAYVGFSGSGCVISQAAASMLMEKCKGKTIEKVLKLTKDDIMKMIGLQLGPVRLRCALLCLHALQEGLKSFKD